MKLAHSLSQLTALSLALLLGSGSTALSAATADDPAWRRFQHALGEPAAIGANASHPLANTAYRPIPALSAVEVDVRRFQLGFRLFHDGRLSSGNAITCITCHAGPVSGVDGRRVSLGVNRTPGTMNALTTFNADFNFRQFWDGRAVTLEDQSLQPIVNPGEMANTLDAVVQMLRADASYAAQFAALYPDGVTSDNLAATLAYFQRIQFTKFNTPFMRHLNGEAGQFSEQALRGWQRFDALGCVACHNGINLGGNSYQRLGAIFPYYGEDSEEGVADLGVAARSGLEQHRNAFKVPSLHHVAHTAPYFHDGSVASLEAAITAMARYQLGRELDAQDVNDLAAFLRAVGGNSANTGLATTALLGDVAVAAQHPASTIDTPALDQTAKQQLSHQQAYTAAIAAIAPAHTQLLLELQRISIGQVAHFDFLQFQHLELLRHARALQHLPAEFEGDTRQRLQQQAAILLAAVEDMEWSIADFLQATAMTQVYNRYLDAGDEGALAGPADAIEERLLELQSDIPASIEAIATADPGGLAAALSESLAQAAAP